MESFPLFIVHGHSPCPVTVYENSEILLVLLLHFLPKGFYRCYCLFVSLLSAGNLLLSIIPVLPCILMSLALNLVKDKDFLFYSLGDRSFLGQMLCNKSISLCYCFLQIGLCGIPFLLIPCILYCKIEIGHYFLQPIQFLLLIRSESI